MSLSTGLKKAAVASFLAVAALLLPSQSEALEINKYDQLSLADKTRYVQTLLQGTERLLQTQGKTDVARRMGQLFSETQPGEQMPRGMQQFGRDLIAAELYQQETGKTMHVEYALIVTLKRYGIEVPKQDMMTLAGDFRPTDTQTTTTATQQQPAPAPKLPGGGG